jgi:Calcineurin-like phosphoesterase
MRIGIFTDIHENSEMLIKALRIAEASGCNELLCLGDIVGFDLRFYRYDLKRSAGECVRLIKSNCKWVVAGNHDLFASGRIPVYSNGFTYPEIWFKSDPGERRKLSLGKVWSYEGDAPNDLGEDEIVFLRDLPEFIVTSAPGIGCLFSHYIYPDFTGSTTQYIKRNHHLDKLWEFMDLRDARYSFSGHSHSIFAGFAYKGKPNGARSYLKAIHSIASDSFNLGDEQVMVQIPPLSGEKGRTGFSIFDTDNMTLIIKSINSI